MQNTLTNGDSINVQGGLLRLPTFDQIDGRTRAAKSIKACTAAMVADLGGAPNTSEGERQVIQRIAIMDAALSAMEAEYLSGHGIALAQYLPMANAQRRLLGTLGTKRRAAPVSLSQYIARTRPTPQGPSLKTPEAVATAE